MRLRHVAVLILSLTLAVSQPVSAQQEEPAGVETHARLGPVNLSGLGVEAIAVSPNWPEDRTLLLLRRMGWPSDPISDLVRSRDGGQSWEWLPAPAMDLTTVTLVYGPSEGDGCCHHGRSQGSPPARRCLAAGRHYGHRDHRSKGSVPAASEALVAFALGRTALFRSVDLGTTWQMVAQWPEPSRVRSVTGSWLPFSNFLTLSPAFSADGVGFLLAAGRLFRTGDAGLSWQPVGLAEGQCAQQVAFSPDFANDRTVFLASVSGGFPMAMDDSPVTKDSTEHVESVGVMVSMDGGETWVAASAGLEVEGMPYRHVQQIVPSPNFVADGLALYAARSTGVSPSQGGCALLRTADGGDTWTMLGRESDYPTCYALHLLPSRQGETLAFVSRANSRRASSSQWWRSFDGGVTWDQLRVPLSESYPRLTFSPAFGRDETLFLRNYYGGIWAVGSGLRSTDGSYPCPAPVASRFAPVLDSDPELRQGIGCPVEPERAVQVRGRPGRIETYGEGRFLWTEDNHPLWFIYGTNPRITGGPWMRVKVKAGTPWPDDPYETFEAVVQPFEKGLMMSFARGDGERVILVLRYYSEKAPWRELPEDVGP